MSIPDTQNSFRKMDETLDLLNDAARLKKEEFSRLLTAKVLDLKETVAGTLRGQGDTLEGLRETIEEAMQESEEALRESADLLKEEVRKNPWPFLAGAAAAALLFGFFTGRSKR